MGLDMTYQALPDDFPILARARKDTQFCSLLEDLPWYLTEGESPEEDDSLSMEFATAVHHLKENHPGIEARQFHEPHRAWEVLCYLLSSEYRIAVAYGKGEENQMGLMYRAVKGGDLLHPEGETEQGLLIRYLGPDETLTAAQAFDRIKEKTLRSRFHPNMMMGVYKGNQWTSEGFPYIWESFVGLRDFYRKAASCREGVLAILW